MNWIKSVRVENYQSIRDATIELAGLTVLVGKNRSGKSAMLRALRSACVNEIGTSFITAGQSYCRVTITKDTGDLVWEKKRTGQAQYTLTTSDGEQRVFTKLAGGVPLEVIQFLSIRPVEIDKTLTLFPQLHDDRNPNFLLDKTEGQVARALAKMTRLDIVVEAQNFIRTDLHAEKRRLTNAEEHVTSLEAQLAEYDDLPARTAAQEVLEKLVSEESIIRERCYEREQEFARYTQANNELAELSHIPDFEPGFLQTSVEALYYKRQFLTIYENAELALRKARALPEVAAIARADCDVDRLLAQRDAYAQFFGATEALRRVTHELAVLNDDYRDDIDYWNSLEKCPTCGQPLEKVAVS